MGRMLWKTDLRIQQTLALALASFPARSSQGSTADQASVLRSPRQRPDTKREETRRPGFSTLTSQSAAVFDS